MLGSSIALASAIRKVQHINWPGERRFGSWNALVLWSLRELQAGDVLIVTRLDRLARSTYDLLSIIKQIETSGARLKSLAETWADTTTSHGRLILTVLGGLAEFERELIIQCTQEGRERAKREGRRLGRPPKLTSHQKALVTKWRNEGRDNAEIARDLGVSRSTVSRVR